MDLQEAFDLEVTKYQATKELAKHGFTFEEFAVECGDHPTYKGETILVWLGY